MNCQREENGVSFLKQKRIINMNDTTVTFKRIQSRSKISRNSEKKILSCVDLPVPAQPSDKKIHIEKFTELFLPWFSLLDHPNGSFYPFREPSLFMFSVGVGFVGLGMLVDKGPNVVGIKTCSQCMSSTLAPSLTLNEKSNLDF